MSLTRPAYAVTITNEDTDWTETVTAGDTYDPNAGVWLADGLELSWRFVDQLPSQLEPETAKFAILADSIDDLPAFDTGDRISVVLERPTLSTPISYMEFAGRVTDTTLGLDAKSGRLLLSVIAVDPTSELNFKMLLQGNTLMNVEAVPFRIADIYAMAEAAEEFRWLVPKVEWDMTEPMDVADFVERSCNAGLNDTDGYPVLRYAPVNTISWTETNYHPDTAVWTFFLARWLHTLSGTVPALLEYAWDATDADQVTTTPVDDPDPTGALLVLDACHIPDLPELIKDRTVAPNIVLVRGVTADGHDEATPAYAIDYGAYYRFGAITREVQTQNNNDLPGLASRYLALSPSSSADAWQFPTATVMTHVMDDTTLDTYAPMFWTQREPTPGVMGRPVALVGIPAEIDPTGGFLLAHLYGATFKAEGGKLAIDLELVPTPLPTTGSATPSPTYDDFGASAFGNATYHDQGGTTDYVDQDLTNEKAKLTSL